MAKALSLTVYYEPVEGGWTQARIAELPAVITAAPTAAEAADQLADALHEYLLALQPPTGPVTPPAGATPGRITLTIDADPEHPA
jgi:predicted RNase H-like HicB family nuclease